MPRNNLLYRSLFRLRNIARRLGDVFSSIAARAFTVIARGFMHGLRQLDPDRSSNLCGRGARRIGPWLPVSRTGRANLRAAFPEKTDAEIEKILAGVWENLGRVVGEFASLDRLWDWDPLRPDQGRIISLHSDRFFAARDSGKPSLNFGAHLANWELAAVGAAAHGADAALLFRIPGVTIAAEIVQEIRSANMGRLVPSSRTAVFQLAREIERGAHVGMLVDQFWTGGPLVTFFGRQCPANPTIARLARQYDCDVRGIRVIRLPGNRFRAEATEPLDLPRDRGGKVDVAATMQMITSIIEGWVREYPEQWLWLHRRWRDYHAHPKPWQRDLSGQS